MKSCRLLSLFVSVFIFSANLYAAEAVFLKNGEIVEGKIVKETDDLAKIELDNLTIIDIKRSDILRIVYHHNYKIRYYITKTSGEEVEVFIVDEDIEAYTCRLSLDFPVEIRILKNDIETISKKKVSRVVMPVALTDEQILRSSAPRVRIAFGITGPGSLSSYEGFADQQSGDGAFALDIFPLRLRNEMGNGFDLIGRFGVKWRDYDLINGDKFFNKFGVDRPSDFVDLKNGYVDNGTLGAGLTYTYTIFLPSNILVQCYGMAYYNMSQSTIYYTNSSGTESSIDDSWRHGPVGGVGLELVFWSYIGFFTEFTYGYNRSYPKKINMEGGSLLFGISFRSSFVD